MCTFECICNYVGVGRGLTNAQFRELRKTDGLQRYGLVTDVCIKVARLDFLMGMPST